MKEKMKKNKNFEKKNEKSRNKSVWKKKSGNSNAVQTKSVTFSAETIDNELEDTSPKKKRRIQELGPIHPELEKEIQKPENVKNVISKRQLKKEKYEKMQTEYKLKNETQMQQKVLNYLSLWKHNRQEWKFEKIKQVWLQTHMFDSIRIPDEFWDITVQYFSESKGKVRQFLMEKCMKVIDKEEKNEDDIEENEIIYKRARELAQNLGE